MAVADDSPLVEPERVERTASELRPEELDSAVLVLLVDARGQTHMWVKDTVDDEALGVHLHNISDHIASGAYRAGCAACASGEDHGH